MSRDFTPRVLQASKTRQRRRASRQEIEDALAENAAEQLSYYSTEDDDPEVNESIDERFHREAEAFLFNRSASDTAGGVRLHIPHEENGDDKPKSNGRPKRNGGQKTYRPHLARGIH